jgi:hypothetical protein
MIDDAAIDADVQERNRLRQEASLPLLDTEGERARLRKVALDREYQAACQAHRPLFEAIRAETEAEVGLSASTGWITRLGIHTLAKGRFEAKLAAEFGIVRLST